MYIAARSMDDSGTLAAVTFLLRNNAVYELLPFMLLLIFCIPRGVRKRMACAVCAAMLVYGAAVHGLYPALGFKKGSEREMLSIPFQQTALYVAYARDSVRHAPTYTGSNEHSGLHRVSPGKQYPLLSACGGHDAGGLMVDCIECIISQQEQRRRL